ncbi:MAG: hypothetical protein JWN61_646 [Pseudonocardiales bacterium]|nr:hypothetical protein [Pseudonocardiales bacterium]
MHEVDLVDALGRDLFALREIGPVRARTAGELVQPDHPANPRGWIYAGSASVLFVADRAQATEDAQHARVLRFDYARHRRARLWWAPFDSNAVIEFVDGTVLLGARRQMQAIHELCTGAEY